MIRLCIIVEGETEEAFVDDVLAPHLWESEVFAYSRLLATSPATRGGVTTYAKARRDVLESIHADPKARFTTMLDLYGLPREWPGVRESDGVLDVYERVGSIEEAFADDIGDRRFLPYIQIHEFEALLLSDPQALLGAHPNAEYAVERLKQAVAECGGPELVNDGAETHPASRIADAIPLYRKTLSGLTAARMIGISRMREACPHFREWVDRLATLAG